MEPTSSHQKDKERLVLDEALLRAVRSEYESALVELNPIEAAMTLDAFDCFSLPPGRQITDGSFVEYLSSLSPPCLGVEVSLFNPKLLANQLEAFGLKHGLLAEGVTVPLDAAERAVARFAQLLRPSKETRKLLLYYSGTQPVVRWTSSQIGALFASLAIPVRSGLESSYTAREVLATPSDAARAAYGVSSTFVLLRYAILRHTLVLLSKWGEDATQLKAGQACPKRMDTTQRAMTDTRREEELQRHARLLPGTEAGGEAKRAKNGKGKGRVRGEPRTFLAPYPILLQALAGLVRALAVPVSLDDLRTLVSFVAGLEAVPLSTATLARNQGQGQQEQGQEQGQGQGQGRGAGCEWVAVQVRPITPHLLPLLFQALAPANNNKGQEQEKEEKEEEEEEEEYEAFVRLLPSPQAQAQTQLQGQGEGEGGGQCIRVALLVPRSALFPSLSASASVPSSSSSPGVPLTLCSAFVGQEVLVSGLSDLTSSCARFDWWDRPTPAALALLAGGKGRVVSVSEEGAAAHRVGVLLEASAPAPGPASAAYPSSASASASATTQRGRAASAAAAAASEAKTKAGAEKGVAFCVDALPIECLTALPTPAPTPASASASGSGPKGSGRPSSARAGLGKGQGRRGGDKGASAASADKEKGKEAGVGKGWGEERGEAERKSECNPPPRPLPRPLPLPLPQPQGQGAPLTHEDEGEESEGGVDTVLDTDLDTDSLSLASKFLDQWGAGLGLGLGKGQDQGQDQGGRTRATVGAPRFDAGSPSRLGLGAADDPSVQLQYAEFRSQGLDYSSTFSASGFALPGGQSLSGSGLGQGQGQSMLAVLRQVARGRKQETPSPQGPRGVGLGTTDHGLVMGEGLEGETDPHPVLATFRRFGGSVGSPQREFQ